MQIKTQNISTIPETCLVSTFSRFHCPEAMTILISKTHRSLLLAPNLLTSMSFFGEEHVTPDFPLNVQRLHRSGCTRGPLGVEHIRVEDVGLYEGSCHQRGWQTPGQASIHPSASFRCARFWGLGRTSRHDPWPGWIHSIGPWRTRSGAWALPEGSGNH